MGYEPAAKVTDPALLAAMAAGDDMRPVSVLIEVDVPAPRVGFREEPGSGRRVPAEVLAPTPEEQEAIDATTAAAGRFLEEVLGGPPVWLEAANAFVAATTGSQLQEIARSRLVKAIHPNRRLGS
jgi:hypothetical protein